MRTETLKALSELKEFFKHEIPEMKNDLEKLRWLEKLLVLASEMSDHRQEDYQGKHTIRIKR